MRSLIIFTFTTFLSSSAFAQFSWKDEAGKHTDLLFGERKVARYVYEGLDPERREETYKPFHHIYDSKGENFITKGAGGKFTHHRAIYFGFSKISFIDTAGVKHNVDTWHAKRAYEEHEELLSSEATANTARHKAKISWRLDDGSEFLKEERELTFQMQDDGILVTFASLLSTKQEKVHLDGDPQHAGFQFRASNEVAAKNAKQTYYIRPETGKGDLGQAINGNKGAQFVDLPWKAMSFVVAGERYTTVYLDHPTNPKPATYSERDYGRFGSYFVADVLPDKPLKVNYRLFIKKGELTAETAQALHDQWLKSVSENDGE